MFWFNPLVWIACTRLRQESERACDDMVIASGVHPTEYASQLVELARTLVRERRFHFDHAPAPAIARPSSLERRITAMLHAPSDRSPLARRTRIVTVAVVLAVAIALVGFTASAQAGVGTLTGTLFDQVGKILPEQTITLTNTATSEKREVLSDQNGRFAVSGLPAGEYLIGSGIAGFDYKQGRLTIVAQQQLQRDIALQVGSIEETVTVTTDPPPPPPPAPAATSTRSSTLTAPPPPPPAPAATVTVSTTMPPDPCGQSPVGGCIRPPVKLKDARPIYPESLRGTNVEGKVVLEGRLGTDGFVKDLRVQAPANPDLAASAADAVRRWQFSATQLDGVPIEIPIMITIWFSQPK
jgi:TonB family protein